MNKYQVVIDEIVNKDNISEKDFIINKMVENMVFLLNEVDLFIENNKTTLIFPLLRQVYEYCLLSLALQESIISLSDFLYPVYSDGSRKKDLIGYVTGKIYDYVLRNSNKDTANVFKSILKSLKQQLNDHTHAGFDRLLRFMMESNNKKGASDFIKEDARFIEWHVKLLFITFVNEKYNIKIELDNFSYAEYLKRNTKESLSLILPDDYERLMESSDVKRYISYKTKDVKVISEHIDEFKTIISNLSDEKEEKVSEQT